MKSSCHYLLIKITSFVIAGLCNPSTMVAQATPEVYLDHNKPVEKRVKDLISRMTVEEKAQFLNHIGAEIKPFNLKSDKWNQSLHGVVWIRPTTLFPVTIAMEKVHKFRVEPGAVDVMLGSSCEDIRLKSQFKVTAN